MEPLGSRVITRFTVLGISTFFDEGYAMDTDALAETKLSPSIHVHLATHLWVSLDVCDGSKLA